MSGIPNGFSYALSSISLWLCNIGSQTVLRIAVGECSSLKVFRPWPQDILNNKHLSTVLGHWFWLNFFFFLRWFFKSALWLRKYKTETRNQMLEPLSQITESQGSILLLCLSHGSYLQTAQMQCSVQKSVTCKCKDQVALLFPISQSL